MSILDDEIILKVENAEKNLRAIIDITAGEIYQAVEDGDNETRGYIDTKADEILAQVDDMAQELTGLIDVQAGAVSALVEGGGASGSMSLSLNLPIMIDATTRTKLVNVSSEQKVAAVYALIEGTEYYGIKGNASDQTVKALWDDAVAGNLIASQIVLDADQINLAGKTIFTSQKTASLADTAQSNAEATAASLANAAQSAAEATAAADATQKANAAQSNAEATAASQRNEMATKLGYASYDAMVQAAAQGQTIIEGGYLRTALIDVANILTKNIMVKDKGVLSSSNYNGTIDADGNITEYGSAGWAIDHAGKSDFVNINATGGNFSNVSVSGFVGAKGLDFILEPGTIEQFYIYHEEVGGIGAVNGQYIVIPFKGNLKYRMEMYDNSSITTGDTVYKFYLNGNLYKSFAYPKSSENHIYEGQINLNFGDELKCQMENAGGRVSSARFYVRFYANSENYFLNIINKSQIKNI